jgi:hypothetical protein
LLPWRPTVIKEIKRDAFWMISVSACIYIYLTGHGSILHFDSQREIDGRRVFLSDFNFFVTKEINNLFLLRKELREILFGFSRYI